MEFWGVKQKLENIRDKIRGGISETNETLARIEGFAEGMTASNDMFVNSFRMTYWQNVNRWSILRYRITLQG